MENRTIFLWRDALRHKKTAEEILLAAFAVYGVRSDQAKTRLVEVFQTTTARNVTVLMLPEFNFAHEVAQHAHDLAFAMNSGRNLEATIVVVPTFVAEVAAFATRRSLELLETRYPECARAGRKLKMAA